jgi:TnpA family transposase
VAELWWKKIRRLEQELAEARAEWMKYQKDWNRMLTLVHQMDRSLEREQDLVKRLSKSLIEKKTKKKK